MSKTKKIRVYKDDYKKLKKYKNNRDINFPVAVRDLLEKKQIKV